MVKEIDTPQPRDKASPRDHLANERTFLAWIRTSVGIMAFGFVVEKFALFIKQIAALLGRTNVPIPPSLKAPVQGYSSIFGVVLVALGALICFLAFIKYKNVAHQIETNTYSPSPLLNIMLMLAVLLIGVFLAVYLVNSL